MYYLSYFTKERTEDLENKTKQFTQQDQTAELLRDMIGPGSAPKVNDQKFPREGAQVGGNELILDPLEVKRARGQEPTHFPHCQKNSKERAMHLTSVTPEDIY